ncbi:MAG TPA: hypothetical protein VH040_12645, partial [Usitatibacter sp.]|nr:hypothetical protein [Usitatibacter sp.]
MSGRDLEPDPNVLGNHLSRAIETLRGIQQLAEAGLLGKFDEPALTFATIETLAKTAIRHVDIVGEALGGGSAGNFEEEFAELGR